MAPLTLAQVKEYIDWRVQRAGMKILLVFELSAHRRIYEYSHGVPRVINNLADKCLMAAYVRETRVVTREIVDHAYLDMVRGAGDPSLRFLSLVRKLKFWTV